MAATLSQWKGFWTHFGHITHQLISSNLPIPTESPPDPYQFVHQMHTIATKRKKTKSLGALAASKPTTMQKRAQSKLAKTHQHSKSSQSAVASLISTKNPTSPLTTSLYQFHATPKMLNRPKPLPLDQEANPTTVSLSPQHLFSKGSGNDADIASLSHSGSLSDGGAIFGGKMGDLSKGFFQTVSNTELFYPSTFTPQDIQLIERYASNSINTFGVKHLLQYGHPRISNAIVSAAFLSQELPARYAQRIELLRDFPFEVNRHPLVQQVQAHYLYSLRLVTAMKNPVTTIEDLHTFNKILLELVYQSSLLPSSTLSHALCTAFGDILLQQLISSVTKDDRTPTYSAVPHHLNPKAQESQFINAGIIGDVAVGTGLSADTQNQTRDALFTVVNDSTASLTLFNSVLQEVLDSFNVSRLDTRLLMTQHCQFCQQLFRHLGVDYDYPLAIDPMAPSGHDEFGMVIGQQVTDFFAEMRKEKKEEKSDKNGKNGAGNKNGQNKSQNETNSSPSEEPYDQYAGDYGQNDEENVNGNGDQNDTNGGTNGSGQAAQNEPNGPNGQKFSLKDGYNGFIGIVEMKLSFPRVIAEITPYATHQAASRYAKYTLERSFKKFLAKNAKNAKKLNQSNEKGDQNQNQNTPHHQKDDQHSHHYGHDEDSDFEPISNTNMDQVQTTLRQKKNKKLSKGPQNDQNGPNNDENTQNAPQSGLSLSETKRLEDEFHSWCDDLTMLDQDWTRKMNAKLKSDFEQQHNTPHPTIPGYQTVLLEMPPLEIDVPARFYSAGTKGKAGAKNNNQNSTQKTQKSPPNSAQNSDDNQGQNPIQNEPTTKILIPLPKVRISGNLNHHVIFPRPHANLIIRELLSNAIENTLKNTLELSKTTTNHLLYENFYPNYQKYNHYDGVDVGGIKLGDKMNAMATSGALKGKNQFHPDDPRKTLVTAGLMASDYVVLNEYAQLPPIEVFVTKASTKGGGKKDENSQDGQNEADTTPSSSSSQHNKHSHPHDDVLSIKISDRANGLNQHRAKAVLTYGNALIQGHLNKVRQFKQQQERLDEFFSQVEHLRSEHYLKYGVVVDNHVGLIGGGVGGSVGTSVSSVGTATTATTTSTTPTSTSTSTAPTTSHNNPIYHHFHNHHLANAPHNDLLGQTNVPPFIPPQLPPELREENLIKVNMPTADHYGPTALEKLCVENQPPRGFGLPLAKATVHFLHGELKLNSIEGLGTDAYVRLVV